MPIKKAAKKAWRQAVKRTERNLQVKKKVEFLSRSINKALKDKKLEEAEKFFLEIQKTLDKAAKTHVFHANKSARKKSRIKKAINALKK